MDLQLQYALYSLRYLLRTEDGPLAMYKLPALRLQTEVRDWLLAEPALPSTAKQALAQADTDSASILEIVAPLADFSSLPLPSYRYIVASALHARQSGRKGFSHDLEDSITLFVYLLRCAQQLPEHTADRVILEVCRSQELVDHFQEDFVDAHYERARLNSIMTSVYHIQMLYREISLENWREAPDHALLVNNRFAYLQAAHRRRFPQKKRGPQAMFFVNPEDLYKLERDHPAFRAALRRAGYDGSAP